MEIYIRLAGMELGPYSVSHVRESLGEGLLSLKDPARIDGTETWLPVGELLSTLPEPTPEPPKPSDPPPEPDPLPALPLPASLGEKALVISGRLPQPKASALRTSVRIMLKKHDGEAKADASTVVRAFTRQNEPKPRPKKSSSNPPPPETKTTETGEPSLHVTLKESATSKPATTGPVQPAPLHVPIPVPGADPVPSPTTLPAPAEQAAPVIPAPVIKSKPAPRRMRPPVWAFAMAAGFSLIAFYFGSAYFSADSLWQALSYGRQAELARRIDFPAVRQSLKQQFNFQLSKVDPTTATAVKAMIESSIELYVTPDGLAKLSRKSEDFSHPPGVITVSPEAAGTLFLTAIDPEGKKQHFAGLDDYVIELETARLHLQHIGLGWKLNRIDLKTELPFSALPLNGPTTTTATQALVTPVIETYIRQGQSKYAAKDFDGAIADFSQVLTLNPKFAAAFNNRAMARQAKGDFDGAIDDFTQAISIDPQLAEVYFSRGNTKSIKGDLDGAMADFTQAISIDPRIEGAYFQRGNARSAKGDFDGAIADFTQVVTVNPSQAIAYANRGFAKQAKKDLQGAIDDYTQAIALDPKIAATYYIRGLAKQARGEDGSAVLDFNQALDLDPKMAGAYFNRGNAKNTINDLDGAIADYTQALALDPKRSLAYCNRGLAKQGKADFEGALEDYSRALELDPKLAVAYYGRGLIREQRDDLDGSIADSTQALELDPDAVQAYFNRGMAYLTKGKLDPASADLSKFCALVPRGRYSDYARLYLWLIAKAQSNRMEANQALMSSRRTEWNSGPNEMVTRIADFLLDRTTEADLIASADSPEVKKDQDLHSQVWYFAGMKRLLAGDRKMAIEYFRRCLATRKKDSFQYILATAQLRALDPASVPPKL